MTCRAVPYDVVDGRDTDNTAYVRGRVYLRCATTSPCALCSEVENEFAFYSRARTPDPRPEAPRAPRAEPRGARDRDATAGDSRSRPTPVGAGGSGSRAARRPARHPGAPRLASRRLPSGCGLDSGRPARARLVACRVGCAVWPVGCGLRLGLASGVSQTCVGCGGPRRDVKVLVRYGRDATSMRDADGDRGERREIGSPRNTRYCLYVRPAPPSEALSCS